MKELEIDLQNSIKFREDGEEVVCEGSYDENWISIFYFYNYHKSKDNKLRRYYAENKVLKELKRLANEILHS